MKAGNALSKQTESLDCRFTSFNAMKRFAWAKHLLILTLIGIPIAAHSGFPAFDDPYYSLLAKEQEAAGMVSAHTDRPLNGLILELVATVWGHSIFPLVILNLCVWVVFAVEAGLLWRVIAPAYKQSSVHCMVIAREIDDVCSHRGHDFGLSLAVLVGGRFISAAWKRHLPIWCEEITL